MTQFGLRPGHVTKVVVTHVLVTYDSRNDSMKHKTCDTASGELKVCQVRTRDTFWPRTGTK